MIYLIKNVALWSYIWNIWFVYMSHWHSSDAQFLPRNMILSDVLTIFFCLSLSADWDHQLKNKTKQKTNTIARKEKKNPPKKIHKIVSALLLHLTNVVKSSKINFHLYFLSVAFQLHQEKSWKNLKNPQKTKSFILYLKYFKKRQRELNSAKINQKKEYVLNLAPFFLQLLSLICFKCLAVFHVINK